MEEDDTCEFNLPAGGMRALASDLGVAEDKKGGEYIGNKEEGSGQKVGGQYISSQENVGYTETCSEKEGSGQEKEVVLL